MHVLIGHSSHANSLSFLLIAFMLLLVLPIIYFEHEMSPNSFINTNRLFLQQLLVTSSLSFSLIEIPLEISLISHSEWWFDKILFHFISIISIEKRFSSISSFLLSFHRFSYRFTAFIFCFNCFTRKAIRSYSYSFHSLRIQ